jgi:transcriptional regulator with XRE-family HTH domain
MELGLKIKKLRELKNFTQEYMAEELNLTQSGYSKLESGKIDVPYQRLEQISKILGLRLEEVVCFNENMVFDLISHQKEKSNNPIFDNEKKLYEDQIESLKNEVEHLKNMLNKILLQRS